MKGEQRNGWRQEMVWVIKNSRGYYVNPKFKALFTGRTSGFTAYTNEDLVIQYLNVLGEGYHSEYISRKDIPDGERVFI